MNCQMGDCRGFTKSDQDNSEQTSIKDSSSLPSLDVDQKDGATASIKNVLLELFQHAYSKQVCNFLH